MAIRRRAFDRVGPFDVSIEHGATSRSGRIASPRRRRGAPGAIVLYVAAAAVEHRRAGADARLRSLARVAHTRGRAARRFDVRRSEAPSRRAEVATLARWRRPRPAPALPGRAHDGRAQRGQGSRGRDRNPGACSHAARVRANPDAADDFLSGESGTVAGLDALRRELLDRALDAREVASGRRARLRRAARSGHRGAACSRWASSARRTARSHEQRARSHALAPRGRGAHVPAAGAGKFENLNRLLAHHPLDDSDWLLLLDDDVELPRAFSIEFLFLCEASSCALRKPAHCLASHAAWKHTRRQAHGVARTVSFRRDRPR